MGRFSRNIYNKMLTFRNSFLSAAHLPKTPLEKSLCFFPSPNPNTWYSRASNTGLIAAVWIFFLLQESVALPLINCFHEELQKWGLLCWFFLLICIICALKLLFSLLFHEVTFKNKRLQGSNLYMEITCIYELLNEPHASNRNKASFVWNYSFVADVQSFWGSRLIFLERGYICCQKCQSQK